VLFRSGRTYVFPANDDKVESVRLELEGENATIVTKVAGREGRIPCGSGSWRRGGTLPGADGVDQATAGSGAWTSDDTYVARVYLNETPFRVDMTLRFADGGLVLDREYNVALGTLPTRRTSLAGRPIDPSNR